MTLTKYIDGVGVRDSDLSLNKISITNTENEGIEVLDYTTDFQTSVSHY